MSSPNWRVWILGSGTALPSAQRDNTFLAVEIDGECWLVDCASAPYRKLLQAGLDPLKLRGVILTHAHADHIYGLPVLLFQLALAGYEGPLVLVALQETRELVEAVVQAFALGEYCARLVWRVVDGSQNQPVDIEEEGRLRVRVAQVCHSRPALGVRLEGQDGIVVAYSGDTGPCPGVRQLAQGANWLLHECTVSRPYEGHSTPENVGQVAREAQVERLGIVHYDPLYVLPGRELVERVRRQGFAGEVRILQDMDVVP